MNITTVKLGVDSREVDKAKVGLRSMQDAAQKAEKASTGLGKSLAAIASSAVIYQITRGLTDAVNKASDLQEAMSKFDTVFSYHGKQAKEWANTLTNSYKMSRRESVQYLSSLQDLLVPMGMASGSAAELSFEITKLATDLGSFNNQLTSKVIDDYQSALVGNYETMKKYGVVLTAATVEQRAMSMGLAETKSQLTASDKAWAAHKIIVEGSAAAVGDMIRTGEGYANTTKNLSARFEDFSAVIGEKMLPSVTAAKSQFAVILETLTKIIEKLDDPKLNLEKTQKKGFFESIFGDYTKVKVPMQQVSGFQNTPDILLRKAIEKADTEFTNEIKANAQKREEQLKIEAQKKQDFLDESKRVQSELDNLSKIQITKKDEELINWGYQVDNILATVEATEKLKQEFKDLKTVFDPVRAASEKLDEELFKLFKIFDAGLIGEDEFERMAKGFQKVADSAGGIGSNLEKNAASMMEGLQISQRMFDQQSKEYRAIEIAIQAANVAKAVGAILNQASGGDPYTAFSRMVTMAAAVASLGVSVSGFGGGSAGGPSSQDTQGTGSVFGDPTAKSESMLNALEITAGATEKLVGINTGMLNALKMMQSGITGATEKIVSGVGYATASYGNSGRDTTIGTALAGSMNLVLPGVGNLIGKAFGGSAGVSNEGIKIMSGYLFDTANEVLAQSFTIIKKKDYRWSSAEWIGYYQDISGALSDQLNMVFRGIGESVSSGAAALGINQADITKAVNSFFSDTITISLRGLSAEDQQKELEAVFSKLFDNLTESVVPFLDDMARLGEGPAETLARVATNVSVFEEAVSRLGFQAERISTQQFAEMATALIDASGSVDNFINSMSNFFDKFASEDTKFKANKDALTGVFDEIKLKVPDTREALYELMQTLNANTDSGRMQIQTLLGLTDALDSYYDEVEKKQKEQDATLEQAAREHSANMEQIAREQAARIEQIANERYQLETALLTALGDTDALRRRELMTIDVSNRSLQERIWALDDEKEQITAMTEQFGKMKDAYLSNISNMVDAANEKLNSVTELLRRSFDAEQQSIVEKYDNINKSLSESLEVASGKADDLRSAVDSITSARKAMMLVGSESSTYASAKNQLQSALVAARGGDLSKAMGLSSILPSLTQDTSKFYGSEVDYKRDFFRTANSLSELGKLTQYGLTDQEKIVANLQTQIDQNEALKESTLNALQSNLDAILGVDKSILSINAATAKYYEYRQNYDDLSSFYDSEQNRIANLQLDTLDNILAAIESVNGGIPHFASGGYHTGGLRIVGENGPEIESTGPSQIYNSGMIQSMISGKSNNSEIIELKKDINLLLKMIIKNTGKTSNQLERWDIDGLPDARGF